MKKNKILYIVSTLSQSGPTNQLLNIIRNLDLEYFEPIVLTLSSEPTESLKYKYDELNIKVVTLALNRIEGIFKSKALLIDKIHEIQPSIIHTQGLRADSLLSKINLDIPWLMTSRNYPYEDYPMKFGQLKGRLMAYIHLAAMVRCNNVIACSKTISNALVKHNIKAYSIQNGVDNEAVASGADINLPELERPIFISVGSLIPRKNMDFIIDAFNVYSKNHSGSLIILGNGPEFNRLKKKANSQKVFMQGSVSNVIRYLSHSDYFLSSSLSEGLPNTVLEGLNAGLPSLLSDIPSHKEIAMETPSCVSIFKLNNGVEALAENLASVKELLPEVSHENAKILARTVFSASSMSNKYQSLYKELIKNQKVEKIVL
ncbi:hypothetical protein BCS95_15030 [Vibrio breoganii]|uniref:glycosyltransferase n=1 Tax=Vibrio breoganii TaxID=553239 RepID=UPI000C843557|nr:glycosyltransferase [Vibrio breoganii]PMP01117.1 hypothetical protein BCS95_15030 [Vibrio breoganii]